MWLCVVMKLTYEAVSHIIIVSLVAGSREFKKRSEVDIGIRNLVPISPSNSRAGSVDYSTGRFSRHGSRSSFIYDNPKSDISAGGHSTQSNISNKSSGSKGSMGSVEYPKRKLEPLVAPPTGESGEDSPLKFGRKLKLVGGDGRGASQENKHSR